MGGLFSILRQRPFETLPRIAFPAEPTLDELRDRDRLEEIREFVAVCSNWLALPLYLVFWLCDLIYVPEHKWEFLAVRTAMALSCLGINYEIKRPGNTLLRTELIGILCCACNSVTITYLIFRSGDIDSPYYAGLNLVGFGLITFVPWRRPTLIAIVTLTYGPFLFISAATQLNASTFRPFIVHFFFIVGTIVIALVVRHFTENLRRRETDLRMRNELEVRRKTQEAVRLRALNRQFSPQIVSAIQSGRIKLVDAPHTASICTIFIDVVNSTQHVKDMAPEQANKVIAMFLDDTMRTFLKYNITIDKFLGDGVHGMAGDPVPRTDYVESVVDCALEVLARIRAKEGNYRALWTDDMQVRVGIAMGDASVGFFGSEDYFKSYTAIGRPVNLASRLCAAAGTNEILISERVARRIMETRNYTLRSAGALKLKGFESEKIGAFEVTSDDISTITEIPICPEGHGVLHLDNAAGVYVFQCHSCDFVQREL